MSEPTFYVEDPGPEPLDRPLELSEREARHVRSLRLRPGDAVRLTDGRGRLWRGRLEEAGDGAAVCTPRESLEPPPELPVTLAFGVGARDRTLWLVEKAVEMGALALHPVECRRSRSVADAARSESFWRKAGRRAVDALKQCGGARLPEIGPVRDLRAYLERSRRVGPEGGLAEEGPDLLLERTGGQSLSEALASWTGRPPVRVLLGPEGGLTDEERGTCREEGFQPVRLSRRVLRFETAAVAALAVASSRRESEARATGGRTNTTRETSDG